jgi:hypothetical protein
MTSPFPTADLMPGANQKAPINASTQKYKTKIAFGKYIQPENAYRMSRLIIWEVAVHE